VQRRSGQESRLLPAADGVMSAESAAGDFQPIEEGPLAQLVEQETLNLLVVGSIPTRPTNPKDSVGIHKNCLAVVSQRK
jgi:hypothetical protein